MDETTANDDKIFSPLENAGGNVAGDESSNLQNVALKESIDGWCERLQKATKLVSKKSSS
jgi:hypothetical protein